MMCLFCTNQTVWGGFFVETANSQASVIAVSADSSLSETTNLGT